MTEERKKRGRVEAPVPSRLTEKELEFIRLAHKQESEDRYVGLEPVCDSCYRVWPCPTSRLVRTVDEGVLRDEPASVV